MIDWWLRAASRNRTRWRFHEPGKHGAARLRLMANAALEDADDLSTDPCRNGTCRECAEWAA